MLPEVQNRPNPVKTALTTAPAPSTSRSLLRSFGSLQDPARTSRLTACKTANTAGRRYPTGGVLGRPRSPSTSLGAVVGVVLAGVWSRRSASCSHGRPEASEAERCSIGRHFTRRRLPLAWIAGEIRIEVLQDIRQLQVQQASSNSRHHFPPAPGSCFHQMAS